MCKKTDYRNEERLRRKNKQSKRFEIYDKKFRVIFFYENTLIFLRKFGFYLE